MARTTHAPKANAGRTLRRESRSAAGRSTCPESDRQNGCDSRTRRHARGAGGGPATSGMTVQMPRPARREANDRRQQAFRIGDRRDHADQASPRSTARCCAYRNGRRLGSAEPADSHGAHEHHEADSDQLPLGRDHVLEIDDAPVT